MTNEQIKEKLELLRQTDDEFTVVQTGKKNAKVNGLYKVEEKTIVLHNKNFSNDNALMFTAIHEYTHHLLRNEKGGHTQMFWAVFYDLVDIAIEKGIYSRKRCEQVQRLTDDIKKIQAEISAMQKKLGEKIHELYDAATENGERIEDIIEHDCQMTRKKAETMQKMAACPDGCTDEMAQAITKIKNSERQQDALVAIETGKTVYQVNNMKKQNDQSNEDKYEKLEKEKIRIEKMINTLKHRLEIIGECIKERRYRRV